MKTKWSEQALKQRGQIADYISRQFGDKHKKIFLQQVRQTTKLLKSSPGIGQYDPIFEDQAIPFRSIIINGLSKLVYYVEDDTIRIVAFWDTRQEPKAQAAAVE